TVADNADHVYAGATLPEGTWTIKITGLDLGNPMFWNASTVCSTRPARATLPEEDPNDVPRAAACPSLPTYLLGEFVWNDGKNRGIQDAGEAGISGVLVELVRPDDGAVIATARTGDMKDPNWTACAANHKTGDTAGLVCFGVEAAGKYEIRIAKSNFGSYAPLKGMTSTTGGETATVSLSTDNSMNYG